MVESFIAAVEEGIELIVAVSDSTSTSKIKPFVERYPDRVVNVGIAEQNLIGMSAGMALGGYVVATANAAPFLVNRSAEQVRNDVAYSGTNVKMMGLNPGFAYGALGPTHHSPEDISMMRSLGGIRIYTPFDPKGTAEAVLHALRNHGPAYLRVDSGKFPDLPRDSISSNEIFTPLRMTEGKDITILGMGTSAHSVRNAVRELKKKGIEAESWAIPSIRPLKTEELMDSIRRTGSVITVEAHSVHGGLGSLIAEKIAESEITARIMRLGVPEGQFAPASPRKDIEEALFLHPEGIAEKALDLLEFAKS